MTKISQLRALSGEELITKEKELKQELFKLNEARFSGRVEKPHKFSQVKRDIARIKTLSNQKKAK